MMSQASHVIVSIEDASVGSLTLAQLFCELAHRPSQTLTLLTCRGTPYFEVKVIVDQEGQSTLRALHAVVHQQIVSISVRRYAGHT